MNLRNTRDTSRMLTEAIENKVSQLLQNRFQHHSCLACDLMLLYASYDPHGCLMNNKMELIIHNGGYKLSPWRHGD